MTHGLVQRLGRLFALFLIAVSAQEVRASSCFDDTALMQLMPKSAQERPVLVYVWSPRMVYSEHNIAVAARSAAASGLDFVALHDMRVPQAELKQLPPSHESRPESRPESRNVSQPLCAEQLISREALRHFPTAFVITTRGIHAQPVVGAMPQSAWQYSIAQRLKP